MFASLKAGEIWHFWPRGRKLKEPKLKGAEIRGRRKLKGIRSPQTMRTILKQPEGQNSKNFFVTFFKEIFRVICPSKHLLSQLSLKRNFLSPILHSDCTILVLHKPTFSLKLFQAGPKTQTYIEKTYSVGHVGFSWPPFYVFVIYILYNFARKLRGWKF